MTGLAPEVEERRRRAYEETETDEEAARRLQMNPHTFTSWRRARGLPMKTRKPGIRTTPAEYETVAHMFTEGANFEEIAAHINANRIGNRKWLKSPGSVAWNALKLGLITRETLDAWYEDRRRRRAAERSAGRDVFRAAVLERDGHRCAVCGSRDRLEVDHIVEFWRGGPNEPSNGIALCRRCHGRKTHPSGTAAWHVFAKDYERVARRLGFTVETGWCSHLGRGHHYLRARKLDKTKTQADPTHSSSAGDS